MFLNDKSGNFSRPVIFSSDVFEGSRTNEINQIKFGDGTIDVNDLFVTFRRSLDPGLSWYRRYWSGGVRVAVPEGNKSQATPLIAMPGYTPGRATSVVSVRENTTAVATLTANKIVTGSLVGGEDQGKFKIDLTKGELAFISAQDFENPTDGATSGSNTYIVQVRATDEVGNSSAQSVTVSVVDGGAGSPLVAAEVKQGSLVNETAAQQDGSNVPLYARVSIEPMQGVAGQSLVVPLRGRVQGSIPLKVMLLNVEVLPLDSTPPVNEQVKLFPDAAFGPVSFSSSESLGNAAVACLNTDSSGVTGDVTLAKLRFTVPASAQPQDAYIIRVTRFSASPDGLSAMPISIEDGLVTLSNRDGSTVGDGIPDSWRLKYFGSLDNVLGLANADADGDGVLNWAEYRAGTNPNDTSSALRLSARAQLANGVNFSGVIVLRWPSISGKEYVIESSLKVSGGVWIPAAPTQVGTGGELSLEASTGADAQRFFRVRIAER